MCYGYTKDFGRSDKKETSRKPEATQEAPAGTPEPRVKAQDYTFWAFPGWRRSPTPRTPSAERSEERV
ncbi:hypothetical protein [Pseudarthrobacter chlorophenolicus]|uniref:hypothetical protein n=1 Tax=Pseudarthrobacter chlorophenolicus TaxID=85085 RepID=UPI0005F2BE8B|nr:hypothetical protein [Pseudarthrobacter chlorophenolicus]